MTSKVKIITVKVEIMNLNLRTLPLKLKIMTSCFFFFLLWQKWVSVKCGLYLAIFCLSLMHKSIYEVRHWCWTLDPGSADSCPGEVVQSEETVPVLFLSSSMLNEMVQNLRFEMIGAVTLFKCFLESKNDSDILSKIQWSIMGEDFSGLTNESMFHLVRQKLALKDWNVLNNIC